ncbi:predicted protein [Lichtheimia corymbifera JMRC:FSU:9682]|uniref:C3H1-type domain-containing protein n=1 Tax=Lichtheimia corymbifera JMRC:FSU:9682 TaxID=1263082 RepID=A0A068SER3_9FUNG|nr:predicted protein [Lichtheimia corymbifera JMRC:FSU:9682]
MCMTCAAVGRSKYSTDEYKQQRMNERASTEVNEYTSVEEEYPRNIMQATHEQKPNINGDTMPKKPGFLQSSQGIPVELVTHQPYPSESVQKTSPSLGDPMHHDSGSDRSDILLSPTKSGECYPVDNATVADKNAIIRHISKYCVGSEYKGFEDTESAKHVMEMMAIRMPPELQRAILKIIQQTSSHEILDSIANSTEFCSRCNDYITEAIEKCNWILLEDMIKSLKHIPMKLHMLMAYGIGRAVRRIRDKAKQAGKGQLEQQAEELMRQWAALKEKISVDGDDSSTGSNSSTRLALQKDPPQRAKAITTKDFFTSLVSTNKPRASYVIRPATHSSTSSGTESSLEDWKKSASGMIKRPLGDQNDRPSRKRVRFEADHRLVQIREYDVDPEEWEMLNPIADDKRPGVIDTPESQHQRARETIVPAAVYASPQQIPPSPAEPQHADIIENNVHVKVIPLDDVTAQENYPYVRPEEVSDNPLPTQGSPVGTTIAVPTVPQVNITPLMESTESQPSVNQVSQMLLNNPGIMQMFLDMLQSQQPESADLLSDRETRVHPSQLADAKQDGRASSSRESTSSPDIRNETHSARQSGQRPRRKRTPKCRYFGTYRGCRFGDNCNFLHEREP